MIAKYEVSVPLEPFRAEHFGSSSYGRLPEYYELPGVRILQRPSDCYRAILELVAPNPTEAKLSGTARVTEILHLLATWGDGFRIAYGVGINAKALTEESVPPLAFSFQEPGAPLSVAMTANVWLEGHVSVVRTRGDLNLECRALAARTNWPSWLPTALELNYLAVTSADSKTALVTYYSAIEIMVSSVEGNPRSIIPSRIPEDRRKNLICDMENLLRSHGLDGDEIRRVVQRMNDAHVQGTVDRTAVGLLRLGVTASADEVRFVVNQRGEVAYSAEASDQERITEAASLAGRWVKEALRSVLERGIPSEE